LASGVVNCDVHIGRKSITWRSIESANVAGVDKALKVDFFIPEHECNDVGCDVLFCGWFFVEVETCEEVTWLDIKTLATVSSSILVSEFHLERTLRANRSEDGNALTSLAELHVVCGAIESVRHAFEGAGEELGASHWEPGKAIHLERRLVTHLDASLARSLVSSWVCS
jgi:hypothetical protein